MNQESKPQHRWYQFSLRTFFVLIALVSIGLGWWVHRSKTWIAERKTFLDSESVTHLSGFQLHPDGTEMPCSAPGGLWLFGEEGVGVIWCLPKQIELAQRLFPEADVSARELLLPGPTLSTPSLEP